MNRVDGGFALKTPVDAIQEFRILTADCARRIRRNQRRHHDGRDTVRRQRNSTAIYTSFSATITWTPETFFAAKVEPLKQNQFGATLGGPIRQEQRFLLRLL